MGCILTGNITKPAVDAFVLVYFGNVVIVDIQVFPMRNLLYRFADKIFQCLKSLIIHPVIQPFAHVLHNSKTIVHSRSTNLHIACSQ